MSRKVDLLPAPAKPRPMKVVVASPSRSGTLGLYQAMQILGFKTYHLYECIVAHGLPHMEVFEEAVIAQCNDLSGIKKFTKADYERWLGEYDCLVEVTSHVGTDIIEAYADDPDVKFILTERDSEKWAVSVNNTAGGLLDMPYTFPFVILKYFDATLYRFLAMNETVYRAISKCTRPGEADNIPTLQKHYTDYIEKAKQIIPADRLCLIQLEDGLGWENICPFLGLPIPNEAYPGRNEPEKFKKLVEGFLQPKVTAAFMRLGAVAIPTVGVLCWAAMTYGPSAITLLQSR
ncbi:hypothetical protein N7452_007183 [Penicillium brevicompactum]|uniref:Uncharacterized protein n=1 Tax=Penicillium brevicompactum TaxID=5074 RepID=A0A9W9UDB5_PENBR|nr:hypothetical protein N7452_007183 [Penicillium brevicompactum]